MIKSQDELTEQGRQSDVLIAALEKCEKLEEENQQLKENIREFFAVDEIVMERMDKLREKNKQLEERLLNIIDLLQKSCFYLNVIVDGKVKIEHLEQVKTLTIMIDNAIGEK